MHAECNWVLTFVIIHLPVDMHGEMRQHQISSYEPSHEETEPHTGSTSYETLPYAVSTNPGGIHLPHGRMQPVTWCGPDRIACEGGNGARRTGDEEYYTPCSVAEER